MLSCQIKSCFGLLQADFTENKSLFSLKFITSKNPAQKNFCKLSSEQEKLIKQLQQYFNGQRKTFKLSLAINGTAFQKQVWQQLLKIPYGQTRSYQQIAQEIGKPQVARAVGQACHNNPIAIIIPCHRVVGANGKLTGYAAGKNLKKLLLLHEKNNYFTYYNK